MRPLPRYLAFLLALGVLVTASVTLNGSGNIGKLMPKWSVSEECTPVAPGDTSGSVGSASLDAFKRRTSVFAIDNDFTLTDPTSGNFRGNVVASPVAGGKVHLDVAGKLNFLVANRTVDPGSPFSGQALRFGTVGSALSQFANVYDITTDPFDNSIFVTTYGTLAYGYPAVGVDRYDVVKYDSTGKFVWSFQTDASFSLIDGNFLGPPTVAVNPVNGVVAVGDGAATRFQIFTPNGARTSYTFTAKSGSLGSGNGQFGSTSPIPVAFDSSGNLYAADNGNARIQKWTISGSTITYSAQVAVSGFLAGTPIADIAMSPSDILHATLTTATTSVSVGTIRTYNTSLAVQNTAAITAPPNSASGILTLSVDATGVWANWGLTDYLVRYTLSGSTATEGIRWCSGFPAGLTLSEPIASFTDAAGRVDVLFRANSRTGFTPQKVTSFYWANYDLSIAIQTYMEACDPTLGGLNYSFDATENPLVVFPAWSGDVWSKLKEICTAYGVEIYLDDDTIRVEDVGARTITLRNHTPLRITPTNLFGGQQLIMVAQNPTAGGGTVFDASTSNTRFQIDVGQSNTVIVNTLNYPVSVDPLVPTDTLPILPGQYYVLDTVGVHVPAATWLAAGAAVTPDLGDTPGQVKFTLTGPSAAMSGYTGPFTFADSLATTGRAALALTGTGVFTAPKSYTFETGANPTKTTNLVARTINSFAIASMAQIFEIAPAAIDDVSGVNVTVTFKMPTADLLGFGLTTGSIFTAEDSKYRVTNVQFGGLSADVTAVRHITLDDVDTATTGLTVDQRDSIWTGYSIDDRGIKPLALSL